VEGIDPDALTYNTLHRSASMLTLDAGRWLSYLGEPLPRNPYDLGTAITGALSVTDFTTATPALHTR
ncbi:hypothetical protein, partial [Escherichia coli]|uniref:hypothetical protein n=1 Tax=Escherichia coli TaxID=562 RepID=UPI0015C52436